MNRAIFYRDVAILHAANIDQGFLATLGIRFLALMYRAIDESVDGVLLIEEQNGLVSGFACGSVGMGPIYRRMLRHPLRLGWSLFPVIFKPRALSRIFDILHYGRGQFAVASLPASELLSIAVAPEARGSGVAELLYQRLSAHFRERGLDAFKITVGDALAPAHRFYTKMGALPVGKVELHPGEYSTIYVQHLISGSRSRASATN